MSKKEKEFRTVERKMAMGKKGVIYAITIFLGAFLLFLVQPMVSKYILPWYGGSPTVWTTCMLFFQTLLLFGYAYAHFLTKNFSVRSQVIIHSTLLIISLIQLPPIPSDSWKPQAGSDPVLGILTLLLVTIGLPYGLLSATSPLLQRWFSVASPKASPYRLYALSNAGSLLALLGFPFIVEPNLSRLTQGYLWSWGIGLFALCCGITGVTFWRAGASSTDSVEPQSKKVESPTRIQKVLWVAFPAVASIFLLATTNKINQDVIPFPFLWVMPLALYLLSFIICFEKPRWYSRKIFLLLFVIALAGTIWLLKDESELALFPVLTVFPALMFIVSMICHGETAHIKPVPKELTSYYLHIALGGVLGSIFVVIISPLIFNEYLEYQTGILLTIIFLAVVFYTEKRNPLYRGKKKWAWGILLLVVITTCWAFYLLWSESLKNTIALQRNFYGTIQIERFGTGDAKYNLKAMSHGLTLHGTQFEDEELRKLPTTYYTKQSGLGYSIEYFPQKNDLRIGAIGLGVGTVAAWIDSGDYLRVYEINPDVISLAQEYFYYLPDARGKVEIVTGDARLSLEREQPQQFDILVLDAFNSDSPPVHLLTKEAFGIYKRHLSDDGIIAIHISSRHFDFYPVLVALAKEYAYQQMLIVDNNAEDAIFRMNSAWVLMTKNEKFLYTPEVKKARYNPQETIDPILWTDDNSSIFPIFVW